MVDIIFQNYLITESFIFLIEHLVEFMFSESIWQIIGVVGNISFIEK